MLIFNIIVYYIVFIFHHAWKWQAWRPESEKVEDRFKIRLYVDSFSNVPHSESVISNVDGE